MILLDTDVLSELTLIAAAAERIGRRLNVADGQIAAIAKVHRMSIATRDEGAFNAAGVSVVNPWI